MEKIPKSTALICIKKQLKKKRKSSIEKENPFQKKCLLSCTCVTAI